MRSIPSTTSIAARADQRFATVRFTMTCVAPAEQVWALASEPRALTQLLSWCSMRAPAGGELRAGMMQEWSFGRFPKLESVTRVRRIDPGRRFLASRVGGTFPAWEYERSVEPQGDRCVLEDRVTYQPPGRILARWIDQSFVRQSLLELIESCQRSVARRAKFRTDPPQGAWLAGARLETIKEARSAAPSGSGRTGA